MRNALKNADVPGPPPDRPAPPPVVLSIAGFDPSSGAGVSADLQVFAAFGLFGTACISSLTVQSTRGVRSSHSVAEHIGVTLRELEEDMPAVGVKIGMLGDREAVNAVVEFLRSRARRAPVVLDPVLVSSSGAALLASEALEALREELLPLVDWMTPNLSEVRALAGVESQEAALRLLHARYPRLTIVVTGGDEVPPVDVLSTPDGARHEFTGTHVETTSTHGTGCAFSSALLARLVLGDEPAAAVAAAKAYVTEALRRAPGVGTGRGPLALLWPLVG